MELVRGEASESEDESDLTANKSKKTVLALEVCGEASESENDGELATQRNDVLQKLLTRNNIRIWNNLNAFAEKLAETTKPLANIDQLLITSEVTFSSMLSSLKIVQQNIKQLHGKTIDVFSVSFIPSLTFKEKYTP